MPELDCVFTVVMMRGVSEPRAVATGSLFKVEYMIPSLPLRVLTLDRFSELPPRAPQRLIDHLAQAFRFP